jgi:hypothetical protein
MSRELDVSALKWAIQECLKEHKVKQYTVDRQTGVITGSDGEVRSIHDAPQILKSAVEEKLCFAIQNLDVIVDDAVMMMMMEWIRLSLGFAKGWSNQWRLERDTPMAAGISHRLPGIIEKTFEKVDLDKMIAKALQDGKKGIKEHIEEMTRYTVRDKLRQRTEQLFDELVLKELEKASLFSGESVEETDGKSEG